MAMNIGLLGLGRMGTGIARSLLRAGHRVTVYNRTRERAYALQPEGAIVAKSIADACKAEVVLTMLADDAALEAVVFAEEGLLASLPRGVPHISVSTISVALSEKLAAAHATAQQEYVAAPVFGRPEAAEAGRLAVVIAGLSDVVERCQPLFQALGPKQWIVGEVPALANVVKLSGNFLLASVIESLAEAMALIRKSEVDPAAYLEFLTSTLFPAPVYKNYGELILRDKYEPAGFAAPLGLKDMRFVMAAAEAQTVPMPFASVLRDRFLAAIARGNEASDWAVLGRLAAEDAGLATRAPAAARRTAGGQHG